MDLARLLLLCIVTTGIGYGAIFDRPTHPDQPANVSMKNVSQPNMKHANKTHKPENKSITDVDPEYLDYVADYLFQHNKMGAMIFNMAEEFMVIATVSPLLRHHANNRALLYCFLEEKMKECGIKYGCLAEYICQLHSNLPALPTGSRIIDEFIEMMSPMASGDKDLHVYKTAQLAGQDGLNCADLYQACPTDNN
ncbi:hypothetical protein L9F63_023180 [Diploptera punctata]|uniref:Uncharacterized protein n=1 Tax=Diploptera punctata TaxID=6984 RepID=A0AAD8E9I0_DIPPU|nr:hypothetical protein L9F63_023180 [Diploptera punctata]